MIIDIHRMPPRGLDIDQSLRVPEGAADEELRLLGPARLLGSVRRGPRGVVLRARIEASVELDCSRCLEPYGHEIAGAFRLTIVADGAEFGSGESQVGEAEAELYYADEGKAHLAEIAREQIYLLLPLKPVCGAACRGLCPTCGANRNRIECDCAAEEIDPRLLPLLELKGRVAARAGGAGSRPEGSEVPARGDDGRPADPAAGEPGDADGAD
jgi:uncharacterized protein